MKKDSRRRRVHMLLIAACFWRSHGLIVRAHAVIVCVVIVCAVTR